MFKWFFSPLLPPQTCARDDSTGLYWSTLCAPAPPAPPLLPPASSTMMACNNPLASTALQSLVSVSFHTPVMSDGVHGWAFVGVGESFMHTSWNMFLASCW
jgi:hypothetical protein